MFLIITLLILSLVSQASSECANACSGHGKCTAYDMCICNRNWQANDCSERVCQFNFAHVDTPKVRYYEHYCLIFLSKITFLSLSGRFGFIRLNFRSGRISRRK